MDSGKSTLIKSLLKKNTGRLVEPDALCIEQATGRTITGTRIAVSIDDETDMIFCDCPGHLEYLPEIVSGLCASSGYVLIMDEARREASEVYARKLHAVASALGVENIATVHSHSHGEIADEIYYDALDGSFDPAMEALLERINRFLKAGRLPESQEARVVWFDELDGSAKYKLYGMDERCYEWVHEGCHSPGESPVITDLPQGVRGRFLVCHPRKGHIVGVGWDGRRMAGKMD